MYKNLDLDLLVPHPHNVNKISRRFAKKLRHNIEQIGMYETLTVRPHPRLKGKFEVLNGHARLETLRKLGFLDGPPKPVDRLLDANTAFGDSQS